MRHHPAPRLFARLLIAAALLLGLAGAAFPSAPPAQTTLYVVTEGAPLREASSSQASALLRLPLGLPLGLVRQEGAWLRVREPDGAEGWVYRGHVSPTPPAPALASIFETAPTSLILAEMTETARSTRSHALSSVEGCGSLLAILDMRLTAETLEEFLDEGGVGAYAPRPAVRVAARPATAHNGINLDDGPPEPTMAATGDFNAERMLGLNLAAGVVRHTAKPAFGNALQRYVNLVGLAVARYAPGRVLPFRAVVLDLTAPVSFSLPGGLVMVSTGLLAALENEAQLALVLAHETAHASLGHLWAEALKVPGLHKMLAAGAQNEQSPAMAAALEAMARIALQRGIEAKHEYAADQAAVRMALRAGYDPQQLPRAILLIERAGRLHRRTEPPLAWAELHPPTTERLVLLHRTLVRLPARQNLAIGTQRFRASR